MPTFGRARRLLNKSDYDFVFSNAKKVTTAELIILYRKNTVGHARLGMVLPKRIIAKAHDRNYLKRRLRETFRVRQALPAIDIIVLAKACKKNAHGTITSAILNQAWDKLNLCVN